MVFNGYGHYSSVYDVSWCALNGRSFHYAVSCGVEGVFIWKFKVHSNHTIEFLDTKSFKIDMESVPVLVAWNHMVKDSVKQATLVVVSSSNNMISVWKRTKDGQWNNISQLYDSTKMLKKYSTPMMIHHTSQPPKKEDPLSPPVITPLFSETKDRMTPKMRFMMNPFEAMVNPER